MTQPVDEPVPHGEISPALSRRALRGNRDTAWYSITDQDWGWVRSVLEEWLAKPDPKPSLTRLMKLARETPSLS